MTLLTQLKRDFPAFTFVRGDRFTWAPRKREIHYKLTADQTDEWSLLHELGHASLGHHGYQSDIELLEMEVAAWESACKIGKSYGISVDWRHIEQCLDSYRDWLHARSTCPNCRMVSIQVLALKYRCINCHTAWRVSKSRLCRIHRRTVQQKQPL